MTAFVDNEHQRKDVHCPSNEAEQLQHICTAQKIEPTMLQMMNMGSNASLIVKKASPR
jgi:hypothetical protein